MTAHPQGIFWYSDHLPFVQAGFTVVSFSGLDEVRDHLFNPDGLMHSPRDCLHYINLASPGLVRQAMWSYSVFLEWILLTGY